MSAAVADQPADQASESGMANYYASKIGDLSVVSAARGLGREGGRGARGRDGCLRDRDWDGGDASSGVAYVNGAAARRR